MLRVRNLATALLRRLAPREGAILLFAFGALVAAWAFIELADEVLEGERQALDEAVVRFFRRVDEPARPIGPAWLIEGAHDITALGGPVVLTLAVTAVCGYLALERQGRAFWVVLAASLGGLGVSTMLKTVFERSRPDVVPHLAPAVTASFPSGHSMLAVVIYLTLGVLLAAGAPRRRTKTYILGLALLLAFLVGASRVYLGVHYPTDVLAGWTAGLAWAFLCWMVARYVEARGTIR